MVPLIYSACNAGDPLAKLFSGLGEAIEAYSAASQLSKKPVGGTLVHHLGFELGGVAGFAAGAAVEAAVLRVTGNVCDQVYSDGVDSSIVERAAKLLGFPGDATPRSCLAASAGGGLRLIEGCLRRLRDSVLGEIR
ncbi:hypothetical protein [Hyperthermus butylicus]|uniref:hypothetical protein n=1 Tax=Hyperthermus butylicus TaxID=54248 RepID=UPI0003224265|nr:hypothetical protein [Hyperthermus butylicus]